MTIDSVSNSTYTQPARPKAEAGEAQRAGRDVKNDGDSDDGFAAVPRATVNLNGQTVGATISVAT